MKQALFDVLGKLEMREEKERLNDMSEWERINVLDFEAAKFISMLAMSKQAQLIVEVGTGVGYSTLWLAYAASRTGGKVVTCEIDEDKAAEAQTNLEEANMAPFVEIIVGDGREELRHLEGEVDFMFIDADTGLYETYFDVVYKQMLPGTMIVADDVIALENELSDYVTYMQNHPNFESVTVPLGNGLEISVNTTE